MKTERRWIPSRKKDKRGHWSHCRQGHPWAGEGACARCRATKDAARHGSKEAKRAAAKRKRDARWTASNLLMKTEALSEGVFADFWRGMVRLRNEHEQFTLMPMDASRLCLILCEHFQMTPPSKLPAGIRKVQEGPTS